jgi:hypothetical protein
MFASPEAWPARRRPDRSRTVVALDVSLVAKETFAVVVMVDDSSRTSGGIADPARGRAKSPRTRGRRPRR